MNLTTVLDQHKGQKDINAQIQNEMNSHLGKGVVGFLQSEYGYLHYETSTPIIFEKWEQILIERIVGGHQKIRGIGDIKKNRKTTKAAAIAYDTAWRHPGAEIYVVANDLKQSKSRAWEYICFTVKNNPHCKKVRIVGDKIVFPNGSKIEALPLDWAGESGANPRLVIWDEVHGFFREAATLMVSELTIPPGIPDGYHLFTSYAGFNDKSKVWQKIYNMIFEVTSTGEERLKPNTKKIQVEVNWENEDYKSRNFPLYEAPKILLYWSHGPLEGDPGQKVHLRHWFENEEATLPKNNYLRLCKNMWVAGTEDSILEDIWGRCVSQSVIDGAPYFIPEIIKHYLFGGLDGSTSSDHTAFASVYWHPSGKLALGPYRIWRPTQKEPLDITKDVKSYLIDRVYKGHNVYEVLADPYQLHQLITDLGNEGYMIKAFNQTQQNLIPSAQDLFDKIKNCQILLPDDPTLASYANNAVAKYSTRGWIFAKEHSSEKIDFILALSFAIKLAIDHKHFAMPVDSQPREQSPDEIEAKMIQQQEIKEHEFYNSDLNEVFR